MFAQNKRHIFFHVVWSSIGVYLFVFAFFILRCVFFGYFTDFLLNKMAVIPAQIMEDHWYLDFINL